MADDPASLKAGGALLGLLQQEPENWFRGVVPEDGLSVDEIGGLD